MMIIDSLPCMSNTSGELLPPNDKIKKGLTIPDAFTEQYIEGMEKGLSNSALISMHNIFGNSQKFDARNISKSAKARN